MFRDQIFHFIDMRRFDRRKMKAVIDPKVSLRLLVHLGHELAVRAAAIEIVVSRAQVIQA